MRDQTRFSVNGLLPVSAVRNGHADATQNASKRIRVEIKSTLSNDIYICWFPALVDTTVPALPSMVLEPMWVKQIPHHVILANIFDPEKTKWDLRVSSDDLITLFNDDRKLMPHYITKSIAKRHHETYSLSIDQVCTDWLFVWASYVPAMQSNNIILNAINGGKMTSLKFTCIASANCFELERLAKANSISDGIVYRINVKKTAVESKFSLDFLIDEGINEWITETTMKERYPSKEFHATVQVEVTVKIKSVTVMLRVDTGSWHHIQVTPNLKLLLSWLCRHINHLAGYYKETETGDRASVLTSEGERINPALNRVKRNQRKGELEQRASLANEVLEQFTTEFKSVVQARLLYDVQPSANGYTFFPFL